LQAVMLQAVMIAATCSACPKRQQKQHMVIFEMHARRCGKTVTCVCIQCTKVQNAVLNTVTLGSAAMCDDDAQGWPNVTFMPAVSGIPVTCALDLSACKLCTGCSYSIDAPFCSACCRKNLTADSGYAYPSQQHYNLSNIL